MDIYLKTDVYFFHNYELFGFLGSVKDRAASFLIKEAIRLKKVAHLNQKDAPPPTIVEGTAGNTGIGLVHICNSLGFQCHLFMPNNQSKEKIDYLQSLGARIKQFPVAPFNDPNNYNNQAKEYAAKTPNAYWTNQFDNTQNRQAHVETTGEIFLFKFKLNFV